ncbi:MAG: pyruvate dehydrogenase (acetyl-transferring), homodimeric type, partial [Candidatus Eremiobacteraeota bacterium]|nr:pyruvate dehydrogenase (acetyl-transferring), homodimeric type [Candidatus Eremiobacteraeota bacterium]
AYELAAIVRDGLRRMLADQEDVYYYITVMNENYAHPAMPENSEAGILRGAYLLHDAGAGTEKARVQLMGSGTILREVEAAVPLLAGFGIEADVWSATSFNELRRDGLAAERHNLLHPAGERRVPYLTAALAERPKGPVVAATDYMKSFADGVRPYVGGRRFHALGTDGYGRSDYRRKLRDFFEVDRRYIALAALNTLAEDGSFPREKLSEAIAKLEIDPSKPDPVTV